MESSAIKMLNIIIIIQKDRGPCALFWTIWMAILQLFDPQGFPEEP